ncbi:LuxR C-terminal-related transcriptional regulator [Nonomuraea turcica]|uniref:LuxR C-terminal-related transcriptional regulator n=1 Tax=Nonomuraea sp. G32 TaxID=3067274 RepID=UPI00273C72E0|nr:LuxR C-terminal-related transcriptional regulator [Nonomuraea sp. G32]MDP4505935.1 LuxR C-terminal-related transcriptional regulator [Nonomuraea sp. G32]
MALQDERPPAAPGLTHPLINGKLLVPPVRPGTVGRGRLTTVLDDHSQRLAVVVAPAGWGKTTLLADWARRIAPAGGTTVAWLTLDDSDDEPHRFWTYLISALRTVSPALRGTGLDGAGLGGAGLGGAALKALRVTEVDPLEVAVPTLLNDLEAMTGRHALVLDDYHVLRDRRIHEAVEFFLSYLPPSLRLIVASRLDPALPLARLRAGGELAEIRAAGLRFTGDEATGLVSGVAGDALGTDGVAALVHRTEGWAAGIKLMALAIRAAPSPPAGVDTLGGDERHVIDYLTSEVLDGLRAGQRDFLLRTSVLDQLCGPLCDTVLERADSQLALAELERADLFLVALDSQRFWYRYHRLFREALRRELATVAPEAGPQLLSRAAGWHADAGDQEEAIRYLIAAGDQHGAAELLAAADDDFLARGAIGAYLRLGDSLDAEAVRANPRLGISLASAAGLTGRLHRVAPLLDTAEAAMTAGTAPPAGWRSGHAAAMTLRAVYAQDGWTPEELLAMARRSVDLEVDPGIPGWVISRIALGSVMSGTGHHDDAARVLAQAVERAAVAGLPAFIRLQATGLLAIALSNGGDTEHVRVLLRGVLPEVAAIEAELGEAAAPAVVFLRLAEGVVAHRDGQLIRARELLRHAVDLAQITGHPTQVVRALVTLAELELACGDRRAASAALSEADEVARSGPVFPAVAAALTGTRLRVGRNTTAMTSRAGRLAEPLTDREHSILRALCGPLSQREIGAELYLSMNTVKGYSKSLYRKLDVTSRAEAVQRGRDLGLI